MMEIALLENLQRENLNAIEEATAYNKLIETLKITQDELATRLGKSRSHITNMLGLLSLPEDVKIMINEEKISQSHARVLSKIDDKEEIIRLANKIIDEKLNVRDIEALSKDESIRKKHKINSKSSDNKYSYLQNSLSDKLGTKVKVKNGKIEIYFVNDNDLNRIIDFIGITE